MTLATRKIFDAIQRAKKLENEARVVPTTPYQAAQRLQAEKELFNSPSAPLRSSVLKGMAIGGAGTQLLNSVNKNSNVSPVVSGDDGDGAKASKLLLNLQDEKDAKDTEERKHGGMIAKGQNKSSSSSPKQSSSAGSKGVFMNKKNKVIKKYFGGSMRNAPFAGVSPPPGAPPIGGGRRPLPMPQMMGKPAVGGPLPPPMAPRPTARPTGMPTDKMLTTKPGPLMAPRPTARPTGIPKDYLTMNSGPTPILARPGPMMSRKKGGLVNVSSKPKGVGAATRGFGKALSGKR